MAFSGHIYFITRSTKIMEETTQSGSFIVVPHLLSLDTILTRQGTYPKPQAAPSVQSGDQHSTLAANTLAWRALNKGH